MNDCRGQSSVSVSQPKITPSQPHVELLTFMSSTFDSHRPHLRFDPMSHFSPIGAYDQIQDEPEQPDLLSPWTEFLRCDVWNIEQNLSGGWNTTQDKTQYYQCVTQTLTVNPPAENKKQQLNTPSLLDGSRTGTQFGSWRVGNWAEPRQKNSNEKSIKNHWMLPGHHLKSKSKSHWMLPGQPLLHHPPALPPRLCPPKPPHPPYLQKTIHLLTHRISKNSKFNLFKVGFPVRSIWPPPQLPRPPDDGDCRDTFFRWSTFWVEKSEMGYPLKDERTERLDSYSQVCPLHAHWADWSEGICSFHIAWVLIVRSTNILWLHWMPGHQIGTSRPFAWTHKVDSTPGSTANAKLRYSYDIIFQGNSFWKYINSKAKMPSQKVAGQQIVTM